MLLLLFRRIPISVWRFPCHELVNNLGCVCVCVLSHVQLFGTPWTVACQAPLSMGFSRQDDRSGFPFPTPEDLPTQGSNPHLLHWQADSLSLHNREAQSRAHSGFPPYCKHCFFPPQERDKGRELQSKNSAAWLFHSFYTSRAKTKVTG